MESQIPVFLSHHFCLFSMAAISCDSSKREDEVNKSCNLGFNTVKYLSEVGVKELPSSYILPEADRPNGNSRVSVPQQYDLPVIDISGLEGPNRFQVVSDIGRACQETGFFQVINHGVEESLVNDLMKVAREFFELPMEERNKFISEDMTKAVRYGTSFNYLKDQVYCWRDFLKHYCHPLDKMLPLWPSNPSDYRKVVSTYSKKVRLLGVRIMSAIVESLGLPHKKIYRRKRF